MNGSGPTFVVGSSESLFVASSPYTGIKYDEIDNGERFLVLSPLAPEEVPPITVVVNWPAELP